MLLNQINKVGHSISNHSAAGTAASKTFDTLGYNAVKISVFFSTTNLASTCNFQHADEDAATAFENITNAVGGVDFTIQQTSANTAVQTASAVGAIDMRGKKRYIRVVHGGATAQTANIVVELCNPSGTVGGTGTALGATADAGLATV